MIFAQFIVGAIILHVAVSGPVFYYKPLTGKEAARLKAWTPESKQQMWELSGQYEGDMLLTPGQRNGVTDTSLRWPNREIPFEISDDFTDSEKNSIINALTTEYAKTCVRPRLRTASDTQYVYVTGDDTGCWSWVGGFGGVQELNLQRSGCLHHGIIVHEFLHAAGFYHQQSATERDDWVNILWENIEPGMEHNFEVYPASMVTSFGERYDYGSVMHYGPYAFSINDEPTIIPKDPNVNIGQRDGLSKIDIAKLNKMYNCA